MTGCVALRKDVYYVRLTYYDNHQKRKEKWVSTGLSGRGAKQKATAKEGIRPRPTRYRTAHRDKAERREISRLAVAYGLIFCGYIRHTETGENLMKAIFIRIRQHCHLAIEEHFGHTVGIRDIHICRFRISADDIRKQKFDKRCFTRTGRQAETEIQCFGIIYKFLYLRGYPMLAFEHLTAWYPEPRLRFTVPLHTDHKGILACIEIRIADKLVHTRRADLLGFFTNPSYILVNAVAVFHAEKDAECVAQTFLRLLGESLIFSITGIFILFTA